MTQPRLPPQFASFALEEWQSRWENRVEFNLADSGLKPLAPRELLSEDEWPAFLGLALHYPEVRGTRALRERISALYPDADARHVLVTVGAAEANAIVSQTILLPGDEVVVVEPNYQQVPGIAANLGAIVRRVPLRPDAGWQLDVEALVGAVGPRTRLVYLSNPNNPTGSALGGENLDRVVEILRPFDAWLLADEVYRGSEGLTDEETPTFWGRLERVIAVGSMSKAYALSGLRIGWLLAPPDLLQDIWRRHEYATISAGAADMHLATLALSEPAHEQILRRNRQLVRRGWECLTDWVARHRDLVSVVPTRATGVAFVRYELELGSVAVADAIRREANVLVAPGAYLGTERHLRINHARDPDTLPGALERISDVLAGLRA